MEDSNRRNTNELPTLAQVSPNRLTQQAQQPPSNHQVKEPKPRIQLGMSSFNRNERERFGLSVRLAMACIEGSTASTSTNDSTPAPSASVPTVTPPNSNCIDTIRQRLTALTQEITSQHADLLDLLIRFDDLKGWQQGGAKHCAAWMNAEIGISTKLSWEYLRVGRKLAQLPTLKALFRAGKLSWSKVRLISRVANVENEKTLCHAALDAPVSDVKRLCEEYRWEEDDNNEAENARALRQWESRSFTWDETSIGSTRIQLVLPPEIAQAFLNSVEHSLNQLENSEGSMSQRRADAAVLMAERSLQNAGRDIAAADRYQVIVSVDASEIMRHEKPKTNIPSKRPTLIGAGAIANETAKRIACDCSITVNKTHNGEPVDIGRKSRIWPTAMERAIKARDEHCVWPGCTQSRHLHIHHIKHWADGGSTSVDNGACLCSHHHTLVHEGGYSVRRNNDDYKNDAQKLLPSRHRFSIVDGQGNCIVNKKTSTMIELKNPHDQTIGSDSTRTDSTQSDSTRSDSTRSDSTRSDSTRSDSTRSDSTRSDSTRNDSTQSKSTPNDTTEDNATQDNANQDDPSTSQSKRIDCREPTAPPYNVIKRFNRRERAARITRQSRISPMKAMAAHERPPIYQI